VKKSRATSKKAQNVKDVGLCAGSRPSLPWGREEITPVSQENPASGGGWGEGRGRTQPHRAIEQAIQSVGVKPEDVSPTTSSWPPNTTRKHGPDPGVPASRDHERQVRQRKTIAFAATWFDKEQQDAFVAAYEKLDIALNEGTRQFYKRSGDGGRATAITQLDAVIDFIEALYARRRRTYPPASDAPFTP